jgi:two-component system sensor histidine kinase HydH
MTARRRVRTDRFEWWEDTAVNHFGPGYATAGATRPRGIHGARGVAYIGRVDSPIPAPGLPMSGLRVRFLVPLAFISLCLLVLSAVTASSLFTQQSAVTKVLRENVSSRRAAAELRGVLNVLVELEHRHVENVGDLHVSAQHAIRLIRTFADQPVEIVLADRLDTGFADYLRRWQTLPAVTDSRHEAAVVEATRLLETDVLYPCREYEAYNDLRLEESTSGHERTLRQLAWGMAGVGGLGAVAGLILGYGIARGLSQSIRRLRVQLRDVAGKLDPAAAEIVITEQGDFRDLHDEADRLTERVEHMLRELQQREHEVLRSEQLAAVGQLAAGVAHEVRNPLTSIKMLVQAAQEVHGELTPEDLRVIESEVRRTEKTLQTFLDFARPPKAERRPTDLVATVRQVFDLLRPRADQQKVNLFLRGVGDLTLTADEGQLRQVLVNLGLNALDAMPHGGTLTVTVSRDHGTAVVEVVDTGPGISKDMLSRLFQPFASGKDTGLGLGLVISRRIVEDHGGTIGSANRVGGGASFILTLPVGGGHVDTAAH